MYPFSVALDRGRVNGADLLENDITTAINNPYWNLTLPGTRSTKPEASLKYGFKLAETVRGTNKNSPAQDGSIIDRLIQLIYKWGFHAARFPDHIGPKAILNKINFNKSISKGLGENIKAVGTDGLDILADVDDTKYPIALFGIKGIGDGEKGLFSMNTDDTIYDIQQKLDTYYRAIKSLISNLTQNLNLDLEVVCMTFLDEMVLDMCTRYIGRSGAQDRDVNLTRRATNIVSAYQFCFGFQPGRYVNISRQSNNYLISRPRDSKGRFTKRRRFRY